MREQVDSVRGWAVVVAALLATSVLLGTSFAFGVLIDPVAMRFGTGRGGAAIAFALTVALPFLLGPLAGRVADRHGPRPLLAAAAVLSTAGLLICAGASSVAAVYVAYGVGVGGGAACAFVPLVAAVSGWFERDRALALAVAFQGSGIGTVVAAPLVAWLVDVEGFRTTCLVLACVTGLTIPLAAALAAPAPQAARTAHVPAPGLGFGRLCLAGALGSLAAFIPFAFLVPFAIDRGVSAANAALLLSVAGAANVAGRLLVPIAARRLGLLRAYRAALLSLGGSAVIWLGAGTSWPALIAFAGIFGAAYGAFGALSPVVAAELLGATALGRGFGALYMSAGVGALAGPPLAGSTIDATGGYDAAIGLTATAGLAGALVLARLQGPRGRAVAAWTTGAKDRARE